MTRSINPHLLGWGGAALLLVLPKLLGAPWTPSDYAVAAMLLALAGGAIELGLLASSNLAYRLGMIVAVGAALLLVWVNAAVGLLADEANAANTCSGWSCWRPWAARSLPASVQPGWRARWRLLPSSSCWSR